MRKILSIESMSKILENIFEIVSSDNTMIEKPVRLSSKTQIEANGNPARSMLDDLKARKPSQNKRNSVESNSDDLAQILRQKYKKRGILISYDNEGCFELKRVVCKFVEDMKSLGFEDDIWFDKNEGDVNSNVSFMQRLESAEECNAAVMFLSHQYFQSVPSKYESEIFMQRKGEITSCGNEFRVFVVKYSRCDLNIPEEFQTFDVDMTSATLCCSSMIEKASAVVGTLCETLEGYGLDLYVINL